MSEEQKNQKKDDELSIFKFLSVLGFIALVLSLILVFGMYFIKQDVNAIKEDLDDNYPTTEAFEMLIGHFNSKDITYNENFEKLDKLFKEKIQEIQRQRMNLMVEQLNITEITPNNCSKDYLNNYTITIEIINKDGILLYVRNPDTYNIKGRYKILKNNKFVCYDWLQMIVNCSKFFCEENNNLSIVGLR